MSKDTLTKAGGLAPLVEQFDAFGNTGEPVTTPTPRARRTDPATSHAAARGAGRGLTLAQLAVLDVLQYVSADGRVVMHEELIAKFAARRSRAVSCAWYPDLTDSSVRTRCKELVTSGYVRHVDDTGVNARGRKCARWACTPYGQAYDIDLARAQAKL